MSKLLSKKSLFLCMAIALAIIIAGAFIVGFIGFNADSTQRNSTVVEVSDFAYSSHDETVQKELYDFCRGEIGNKYTVIDYTLLEGQTGGAILQFVVSGQPDAAFCASLKSAIVAQNMEGVSSELVTVSSHVLENAPYYNYIWRTAVAAAVVVVVAEPGTASAASRSLRARGRLCAARTTTTAATATTLSSTRTRRGADAVAAAAVQARRPCRSRRRSGGADTGEHAALCRARSLSLSAFFFALHWV